MTKPRLTFEDLSNDIQALIVDRVLRPSDLKNLCLVSKHMHALALKPLYRNVSLDLGSVNDTRLSAFLHPRNQGLQHIRQIRLYLANVRDRCNQKQQTAFATRMVLEFLPEDILEEFSWCPWEAFSADNLLLLYKKQRKMKWLEVMDLDRDVLPDLKKNPRLATEAFSHARKLALYPENRETLDLCHYYVEKTTEVLEELIIHSNFDMHDHMDSPRLVPTLESRELDDSATGPGLIMSTIFSHIMPFEKCSPLKNLTSLRLHRVNLRHCADTWCKLVNFSQMQCLRLYSCPGADSLLGQMSKAFHLPRRLRVLEFQHRDNAEEEALIALDGLLCLASGLTDLVVDMKNVKALPASAGIARHGKTLQVLNVHCSSETAGSNPSSDGENEELVWDLEAFEKICKACTKLEQLSCAWPATSLIRPPTDEWKGYESALITNLANLVTLHVSTWPTNKPSTQLLPRSVYEQLLQGLTKRLFEPASDRDLSKQDSPVTADAAANDDQAAEQSNASPQSNKLRLVAFGISDKIYEREDSQRQLLYLRSTSKNYLGNEMVHAASIGWCARQFIEPRSEILDFVLLRHATPQFDESVPWAGEDDEDFD